MRRILLVLVGAAVLALPAAATARAQRHAQHHSGIGFLVVKNASADGGVAGSPVATVVVHGFVLGRIAQEGAVELFHIAPSGGALPQAAGVDVSRHQVFYRGAPGTKFTGSGFRFRGVGGFWRVVVYGAGVSLYAGGEGKVSLRGSVTYPGNDGVYSVDGGRFVSLPSGLITRTLGITRKLGAK